jgi:hypothetical protein
MVFRFLLPNRVLYIVELSAAPCSMHIPLYSYTMIAAAHNPHLIQPCDFNYES